MDANGDRHDFVTAIAVPYRPSLFDQFRARVGSWLDEQLKDLVTPTAGFVAERAKGADAGAATTRNISVTGVSTGNHLILWIHIGIPVSGTRNVSSITDNAAGGSNTYNIDNSQASSATGSQVGHCLASAYIDPAKGAPTTITVNSTNVALGWKVEEFSGLATTAWFDTTNIGAGAATTGQTSGSATPAGAGELSIGIFSAALAETSWTVGNIGGVGSTQAGTTRNASPDLAFEYVLNGVSGAQTAAGTWASAPTIAAGSRAGIAFYKPIPPPVSLVFIAGRALRRFARR